MIELHGDVINRFHEVPPKEHPFILNYIIIITPHNRQFDTIYHPSNIILIMASSSLTATVQISSVIEGQANLSHQEVEYGSEPLSPPISLRQSSFGELLEPWFEMTPTHRQDTTFSNEEFQPIPRSLMPSDPIRTAGYNLQSITDTASDLFPAANLMPSFETYNLNAPVYNTIANERINALLTENSPLYNPNEKANGLFSNGSPVYNHNAIRSVNGLSSNDSPVYNPNPSIMYDGLFPTNAPVYNPNAFEILNGLCPKNDDHFQFENETSSSDDYSQSSFHSSQSTTNTQQSSQPDLNINNPADQAIFGGYTEWETLLVTCDPLPLLMLPSSDLPQLQSLKRSRSLDSYSPLCFIEPDHPNHHFDLGPGPSKKSKTSK